MSNRALCLPIRRLSPARRLTGRLVCIVTSVVSLLSVAPILGQEQVETLELHAYRLEHQSAREARGVVESLLSDRGTVELDRATNTLILREEPSTLSKILPFLRDFDHPPRLMRIDIHILRTHRHRISPVLPSDDLPKHLVEGLGKMLRFSSYRLLAQARLTSREGERVHYELGGDYEVDFRVGTVLLDQRIRLRGFRVRAKEHAAAAASASGTEPKRLFYSDLNLWLDQTLALGFAQDEASDRSLVVAITCTQIEPETRTGER